jgi:hypothetical protein
VTVFARHLLLHILQSIRIFNIKNLVLGAKSEYNGFAGAGENSFGVLEYWNTGVLAKMKARI